MADICKCKGTKHIDGVLTTCAVRDRCTRFTIPSGCRQSWFSEAPFEIDPGGAQVCRYFPAKELKQKDS